MASKTQDSAKLQRNLGDQVTKSDIQELRKLPAPPQMVKEVMTATCLIVTNSTQPLRWQEVQKIFGNSDLLTKMRNKHNENIPVEVMSYIRSNYISRSEFTPESLAKQSQASASLCDWILALDQINQTSTT